MSKYILTAAIFGIVLFFIGQYFSKPILNLFSALSISIAGILIGIDAIKNKIFREKSRYNKKEIETYIGFAATLKGISIILVGLFISLLIFAVYFNFGEKITQYFFKNPGFMLIVIGLFCSIISITTIIGYIEQKRGSQYHKILDLIFNRFFPSLILALISIVLIVFGSIGIYDQNNLERIVRNLIEFLF
ncbi:MAG: hypothetical protein HYS24_02040 [Ignavibacteriales bacterium]|nr:hypothetical protein [Ignavibacteriales bacterium]